MLTSAKPDAARIRVSLEGLSCANCANRVETAIRGTDGVKTANVNFATARADIEFVNGSTVAGVAKSVADAGYSVASDKIMFDVTGATCGSCVARIEDVAKKQPSVVDAQMNFATGRLVVEVATGAADQASIVSAIETAGYHAEPVEADQSRKAATSSNGMRTNLIISILLALPVLVLEMGGHLFSSFHHFVQNTIGMQTSRIIQFLLTSLILAWPGRSIMTKGFTSLFRGAPEMNSLVAIGASAAWVFSCVATFAPQLLPVESRVVYFESAALIVTLILLGRYLEDRAKGQAGAAIQKLIELRPDSATVIQDGQHVEIAVDRLVVGDVLHLRPGERVAVDGVVESGSSWIDESMISGEPTPVQKETLALVVAGTVNGTGALTYRATAVGQDTTLSQIVRLVEEAQGGKLPIQNLVDKITRWFVPAVLVIALITITCWLLFGPEPVLSNALVAGVSVLIIACPCAMGLAVPTSIVVGTGRAAELGVLFQRGETLQELQEVDVVAFDKTGTLTEGNPKLVDMFTVTGTDRTDLLRVLAAVEQKSEHPIARAIVAASDADHSDAVTDFQALGGLGVKALIDNQLVMLGSAKLLAEEGIDIPEFEDGFSDNISSGKSAIYAAIDGKCVACLFVYDPIKPSAKTAIAALKDRGLKVAMITGDDAKTAQFVADQLGIETVISDVLPDQKLAAIKDLKAQYGKVAFVGDGINDAPALAEANVGIAVGSGTDVAIEAADVVLVSSDLGKLVSALELSRRTLWNIKQNLFWAFGYNVLLIPVAAGVFYSLSGTLLSPPFAAGAMALSSVFVVLNALRLGLYKPQESVS